ncbi:hypothetical protein Y032_0017g3187 [Ancylostoma ceylanicum]|uniref:Uncharacterized protein n=2 Tax=Ancylostoma ceylanicum TaxID=53326 RepID=A0A016V585_9BILA|nr:hypothetical protein Y032_0017g3187 [Ancylostoma ceylanicum]
MLKELGMAFIKMQRITFFGLVLFSAVVSADRDPTFHRFCNNPPNFGEGKIVEGDKNRCQLTYNIATVDDTTAYNFCDTQQPFTLLSARRDGSKTICDITTYYVCQGSDVLIGDKCFIPRRAVDFAQARESCGQDYTFCTISSGFEQKWITELYRSIAIVAEEEKI